jgi:hypothetical protein
MKFTEKLENAGVSADIIGDRVLSILNNTKTKSRYRIDATRTQNLLLQYLPKRFTDKMVAKQMKLIKK